MPPHSQILVNESVDVDDEKHKVFDITPDDERRAEMRAVPTCEEISSAVREVFDKAASKSCQGELLTALVAVERPMDSGTSSNVIPLLIDFEMQEICDFANAFMGILANEKEPKMKTRIEVLVYCHIMEADFPYAVLWNLLHILRGEPCSWPFARTNKRSERTYYKYPREKIPELKRMSQDAHIKIGDVLERLWCGGLRNAFSHSQYLLLRDGHLMATATLFPESPKKPTRSTQGENQYPPETVDGFFQGACGFLQSFIGQYKKHIERFKDGKPHETDSGVIQWDCERREWFGPT